MKKSGLIQLFFLFIFIGFIGISFYIDFTKGEQTASAFLSVLLEMLKILPCAFVIIGLFEVWVKKETVIKHLGDDCGLKGYLWVLLLAGLSVGGLFVAFPIAETLNKKGASLKVIFTYLGFVGVFRIPMTIFEISFLGFSFTFVRLMATIPLFLLIGIVFGTFLKKRNYQLRAFVNIEKQSFPFAETVEKKLKK